MVQLLLAIIYIAFISLGLPDAMLGSAWPTMYGELGVPVSFAGIISMIISMGTVVSSLQSDRLTKKLGAGMVTAISVAMTAVALFGFSISGSFGALCLWAIPYGLGAGSVDAALNNYVALHYSSRDMSWLHCMWGVGTIVGPNVMGYALTSGMTWNRGYFIISVIQIVLSAGLFLSLPVWRKQEAAKEAETGVQKERRALSLREIFAIPWSEGNHDRVFLLYDGRTDVHALGKQLYGAAQWYYSAGGGCLCQPFLHRHHRRQVCQRFSHHAFQ